MRKRLTTQGLAEASKGFSKAVIALNPQLSYPQGPDEAFYMPVKAASAPPSGFSKETDPIAVPHGKKRKIRVSPQPQTKPERAMASWLERKRHDGLIYSFTFEGMRLECGEGQTYCPDFAVVTIGGGLKFIECKGKYIQRTGLEKFKAAQSIWKLFKFEMWQLTQDGFKQIA